MQMQFSLPDSVQDVHGHCRLSRLLFCMQDAAVSHVAALGCSREAMLEASGAVWIATRTDLMLEQPIRAGNLTIETWHDGFIGVIWRRGYAFYQSGVRCGLGISQWVPAVVSGAQNHVLRPSAVPGIFPEESLYPITQRPAPLRLPAVMTACGDRTVQYSDLDVNRHLNNARAADWVLDALHAERQTGFVSGFTILYKQSCLAGEVIGQQVSQDADGSWYLALRDGAPALEAFVRFSAE